MMIDRCICTQRTFTDLIDEARAEGLTLPQLVVCSGASACCTMCGPYVRRAYRTGQTTFTCLLSEDDEPAAGAGDVCARCVRTPV